MTAGRITLRVAVLCAIVLGAGACAGRGGTAPQGNRNLITYEELEPLADNMTLRQVIQRQRPQWLQGRGRNSLNTSDPVIIYLNQNRSQPDVLDRLRSGEVRELQFLDAMNATQRFGTGHRSGAILITSM